MPENVRDLLPKDSPGSWQPSPEVINAMNGQTPEPSPAEAAKNVPAEGVGAEVPHSPAAVFLLDPLNPIGVAEAGYAGGVTAPTLPELPNYERGGVTPEADHSNIEI